MDSFSATIQIIDVNPYVSVPDETLVTIQTLAHKTTSPIPIKGTLNGYQFTQTLVKFRGQWRLYLNTPMRDATKTKVGGEIKVEIEFDPETRMVTTPPAFARALALNPAAAAAFAKLPPYRQKEINRYLGFLKNPATLDATIIQAIQYLSGKKVDHVLFR